MYSDLIREISHAITEFRTYTHFRRVNKCAYTESCKYLRLLPADACDTLIKNNKLMEFITSITHIETIHVNYTGTARYIPHPVNHCYPNDTPLTATGDLHNVHSMNLYKVSGSDGVRHEDGLTIFLNGIADDRHNGETIIFYKPDSLYHCSHLMITDLNTTSRLYNEDSRRINKPISVLELMDRVSNIHFSLKKSHVGPSTDLPYINISTTHRLSSTEMMKSYNRWCRHKRTKNDNNHQS